MARVYAAPMNEEIKSRILLLMENADDYAAAQISALAAGYDAGLRIPNAVCPWSDTDSLGWEWEFGRKQGASVRADAAYQPRE